MVDFTNKNIATGTRQAEYDEGLRAYMVSVYNYMALALGLTGLVAFIASQSVTIMSAMYVLNPAGQIVGMNGLGWLVAFAPLAIVLFMGFKFHSMSFQTAQATFWTYAALTGLSLASIFLVYTGASIARVFFITAGVFGGMSLYGYTTKRDLTGLGSFLIMGVWGILLASIVNIFMQSPGLYFALSILSVLIFTGLVAYDTQKIKETYYMIGGSGEMMGKAAIIGALSLYIDFIAIFINLMRFFGDRR